MLFDMTHPALIDIVLQKRYKINDSVIDDFLSSSVRGCSFTIEHYAIESVVFIAIFPIDLFFSSI